MELISAIATAPGKGGVAIIRISGEGVLSLAARMFPRKEFSPNVLYAGEIDCGTFHDFGMCVYFRAPHSFTGEDVVEFHCHGGTEIARAVLKRTHELGARQAEPGEFTRRAYLNGKLSLSAVEGMGEMIEAESQAQARAGYLLYGEKLTEEAKRLQGLIKACIAEADADADYPEEELFDDLCASVAKKTAEISDSLKSLLLQYSAGKKLKSGVRVALCGRPNAGKSSLLNALLGYDRAIVSSAAGTTRDIIEESIQIEGVLFRLTDTAGLRESCDEIEQEGIRRAENALKSADLIVYLKEDGDKFTFPEDVPCITVGAKSDLEKKSGCDILLSAHTGEGIEELKKLLYEKGFGQENEGAFLVEERHRRAVEEALEAVLRAKEGASSGAFSELFAQDLKAAYFALGKITGETANEEILNEIFSKFCVGK